MDIEYEFLAGNILEICISGDTNADSIIDIISGEYSRELNGSLWSYSKKGDASISKECIYRIINTMKSIGLHPKTAFVSSYDYGFGVFRQLVSYAKIENLPNEINVFRSRCQALEWLKGG